MNFDPILTFAIYLGNSFAMLKAYIYGTKQVSLFLYEKGMIILSVNPQAISNTCIKLIASFQLLLAVNKRMVCIQVGKVNHCDQY